MQQQHKKASVEKVEAERKEREREKGNYDDKAVIGTLYTSYYTANLEGHI